ncbi:MAG: hypothetical protein HC933_06445 [Pleurocapsa sp. SU_196_0]|nr:hypothetical protein [Pleurocapsa sp. SU_196_0]
MRGAIAALEVAREQTDAAGNSTLELDTRIANLNAQLQDTKRDALDASDAIEKLTRNIEATLDARDLMADPKRRGEAVSADIQQALKDVDAALAAGDFDGATRILNTLITRAETAALTIPGFYSKLNDTASTLRSRLQEVEEAARKAGVQLASLPDIASSWEQGESFLSDLETRLENMDAAEATVQLEAVNAMLEQGGVMAELFKGRLLALQAALQGISAPQKPGELSVNPVADMTPSGVVAGMKRDLEVARLTGEGQLELLGEQQTQLELLMKTVEKGSDAWFVYARALEEVKKQQANMFSHASKDVNADPFANIKVGNFGSRLDDAEKERQRQAQATITEAGDLRREYELGIITLEQYREGVQRQIQYLEMLAVTQGVTAEEARAYRVAAQELRVSLAELNPDIARLLGNLSRLASSFRSMGSDGANAAAELVDGIAEVLELGAQGKWADAAIAGGEAIASAFRATKDDVLSSIGAMVSTGVTLVTKLATGDLVGAALSLVGFIAQVITSEMQKAEALARQLEETTKKVKDRLQFTDPNQFVIEKRSDRTETIPGRRESTRNGGSGVREPDREVTETDVSYEIDEYGLSLAESLESSVVNGISDGLDAAIKAGDFNKFTEVFKANIASGLTDALKKQFIQKLITDGVLGNAMAQITKAMMTEDTADDEVALQALESAFPKVAEMGAKYYERIAQIEKRFGVDRSKDAKSEDEKVSEEALNFNLPVGLQFAIAPALGNVVDRFGDYMQGFRESAADIRLAGQDFRAGMETLSRDGVMVNVNDSRRPVLKRDQTVQARAVT